MKELLMESFDIRQIQLVYPGFECHTEKGVWDMHGYRKGRLGYARLQQKLVSIYKCYDFINVLLCYN